MAESSAFLAKKRYAVVTGGNKGIGLEICRQLASQGVLVILTARDEKRGIEAVENLKKSGINPDDLVFHQLDVTDSNSIASLADFIKAKFGKLDILVNNAGISGVIRNRNALAAASATPGAHVNYGEMTKQTYELAEECIRTNYHGPKRTIEVLLPMLQLSDSLRIVNVSSFMGKLKSIPSERIRKILGDVDNLTEEKIDEILNEFLRDFKDGSFVSKGWSPHFSANIVSKAALNALTRVLAKKCPSIMINAICPGFVKTDINANTGILSVEEVSLSSEMAEAPSFFSIQRYAVVTGANKGIGLEICKQLASNGVVVVLTARDENKGLEAVGKLKTSNPGLSDSVIFHQLDVTDPKSIASLADFVKIHFGKLDILVNNAGIGGFIVTDYDALEVAVSSGKSFDGINWNDISTSSHKLLDECLKTNYYGPKQMIEALMPLLQLSDSARVVNVSSFMGRLQYVPNEQVKGVLRDDANLTEEKIDEVLNEVRKDSREGTLADKGWVGCCTAYNLSKAALHAYTRVMAKKHPSICINSVCPGLCKTDINYNTGILSVEEGAASPVKLALMPNGGPSGLFFMCQEVSSFE